MLKSITRIRITHFCSEQRSTQAVPSTPGSCLRDGIASFFEFPEASLVATKHCLKEVCKWDRMVILVPKGLL